MGTLCSNVFSRPMLGKGISNALLERVEPQSVEFNSSTDSELRLQKILALIEDVGIRKIGIWGMGGIGKTRTLKLLNNRQVKSRMFDIVIWVTVSRQGSRRNVQNDIAERLKCAAMAMSDNRLRANIYHSLSGKKFLLILDDIWERIDLSDVGIPILNQDNGCKVLLTSRNLGVCRQMETDVEIQIEKLSKEEAWSLFNEKAGDVAMSPCIEPIARDIVKKCSGLPLAIIVIGSSLRKISYVDVWKNTQWKLQSPSTSQIKGMEKEVFSCLRISYDQLPNEGYERNLFLYCSLFPEDRHILITELVMYCWLEGYIEGVESIEEARVDGHHMVMNLVDASLLERVDHSEEYVKMHDLIRDFALKEASGFLVKSGKHVKHPPEEKEWLQSQKISLMHCGFGYLLERPNCNTLSTLLLRDNDQLKMIPDSFFEYMRSLCILNLSWTGIKSLPTSLCNLVNLRGLFLIGCHNLTMIPDPSFECMHSLCILDLRWTGIKYLPTSLCKLVNLRYLFLEASLYQRMIPDPFFECMHCLRVLNLSWTGIESLPTSLCNLVNLRDLFLEGCHNLTMIPDPFFECMHSLCILDLRRTGIESLPTSLCNLVNLRSLFLKGCGQLTMIPDPLLEYCTSSRCMIPDTLLECMSSRCILDLSNTGIQSLPTSSCKLVNLRGLFLNDCHNLKELPSQVGALGQLEVLHLGGSTAIKYLPREVGALTRLRRLIVGFEKRKGFERYKCWQNGEDTKEWNMKLRVPTGIIPNLPYLEELSLYVTFKGVCVEKEQWDDKSMEVVVKELCRLEHLTTLDAYFPKVECLEHFLAHSKSVKATSWFKRFRFRVGTERWDTSDYSFLSDEKWARSLVYKGGLGMSHAAVIMETLAHSSFFNLRDHHTIRKLSEFGLANMNELIDFYVEGCEKVETLFDGDEQHETCALLPNLDTLYISGLPELRSFCDGPLLPGSLSKLRCLLLCSCKNLKKVFQFGIIRQLCSLKYLCVSDCFKMEEIIEIEEEEKISVASHSHNFTSYNNDRLILPNINHIALWDLPELVSICRGFSNFEWPSLETISILRCPKLKSLSFLSNGTNIVPPALKEIRGSSSWWEALKWEDNDMKQRLQPFHSEN